MCSFALHKMNSAEGLPALRSAMTAWMFALNVAAAMFESEIETLVLSA
jgi:hypothetical protein